MKVELKVKKEFSIKYLKVSAGVRYWDDGIINGVTDESGENTPCKVDGRWCPIIEVETGKIINWDDKSVADLHYEICDNGEYSLLDENLNEIKTIEGYVPDMMCPKESGYGDYIIMDIDKDGYINKWKPSFDEFQRDNED